jgi:hypothetical protein
LLTAFQKLAGQLDQSARFTLGSLDEALSFRPLAPEDTDVKTFDVLSRAVQQRVAVRFQYKKLGARKPERRHVHPHHLACIENVWYVFAHDVDRRAMRTFVLTRLSEPALTGKKFTPQKDFKADEYLKGSFSVFKGGDDYEVVIEFDAWATDLIRGRTWHASQEFFELPDVRRWTDACPVPVLAVVCLMWCGTILMLGLPLTGLAMLPFFGMLLTGIPGALAMIRMACVLFWIGRNWYRLNVAGWWALVTMTMVFGISNVLTFARVDIIEVYKKLGYPQAQIDLIQQRGWMTSGFMMWCSLLWVLPMLGYLLWVRRFFSGDRVSQWGSRWEKGSKQ